jgi:ABC-type polysaccharide/polyol phosphate export permease
LKKQTTLIKLRRSIAFSLGFLVIPAVAMLFTSEVKWGTMDFIIGFTLLFLISFFVQWLYAKLPSKYRFYAIAVAIILFILLWMEIAVGLFDTPIAGN